MRYFVFFAILKFNPWLAGYRKSGCASRTDVRMRWESAQFAELGAISKPRGQDNEYVSVDRN
jgi:hypothetical protein